MTPEEQAAAEAAAAASAAIDYAKFDYTKLATEMAKLQAAAGAADKKKQDHAAAAEAQRLRDENAAIAADAQRTKDEAAAEVQRVKDEADAAKTAAKGAPPPKWISPRDTPEFKKLQADFDAKNAKDADREKKAETKERSGTVKAALSDYTFATESAKTSATKLLFDQIKLGEDEAYVGPDGSPADEYIAKMMDTEFDYFLKPKDVGGSGARNGGSRKDSATDINSIKPGMKAEDRAKAYAEVARVLRG